ncbi:hypothetical protein RUM43_012438 [Polyplax serrata]|uniref:Uncharacterized protein n=1 Tax=Polyplax serrata TaxID=468196 RepID=A0AAN8P4J2_POLSC
MFCNSNVSLDDYCFKIGNNWASENFPPSGEFAQRRKTQLAASVVIGLTIQGKQSNPKKFGRNLTLIITLGTTYPQYLVSYFLEDDHPNLADLMGQLLQESPPELVAIFQSF